MNDDLNPTPDPFPWQGKGRNFYETVVASDFATVVVKIFESSIKINRLTVRKLLANRYQPEKNDLI